MKSGYLKAALENADPRYADVLRRLGHELDDEDQEEPVVPVKSKSRDKKGYNRRDMRAKDE